MKVVGFTPYSHQRAVIEALSDEKGKPLRGQRITVKSSRQKGKSLLVCNLLVWAAASTYRGSVFCLSPTLKQAKSLYKTITDAAPKGFVVGSNSTDLTITLKNKATISFKSAEQGQALRGYTADFLCIDEAAFISDDVFYTVLPWIDVKNASCCLFSTPFTRSGFFYEWYSRGFEEGSGYKTIDWTDPAFKDDIDLLLPPERLEEYRRMLPRNQFKSEYLGEWLDDDGSVFVGFRECVAYHALTEGDKVFVGIDWGAGGEGDRTVVSIITKSGHQIALRYWNDLSTTQQIEAVFSALYPYEKQIVSITSETNSIGTPLTDLLRDRLPAQLRSKLRGFTTTNKSKDDIITSLQVAFEQKTITILNDPTQLRELGVYAAEYNPTTKTVTYNAPRGLHDDTVIALALANYSRVSKLNNAVYSYSFI